LCRFSDAGNDDAVEDADAVVSMARSQGQIAGTKVEGYVDGKLYFEHVLPERVYGRIGLWSKADATFRRLHRDASRLSNAAGGALRSLKAAKDYALVASPAALARDENARLLASDRMHASGSAMRDRID
jgi:hypothetical protein